MNPDTQKKLQDQILCFRLPYFEEIPDVGLYLDQTARYLNSYLCVLGTDAEITTSMISNYVKKHLVENPKHKLYSRNQIATLFFIALTKPVMSLEHVHTFAGIFSGSCGESNFYNCFRNELLRTMYDVFGLPWKDEECSCVPASGQVLVRSAIMAIAHTIYMNLCFQFLSDSNDPS